jgi:NAD(P)-dependent dehydrogenase (short-subunit alcohol dehydrogenase family)
MTKCWTEKDMPNQAGRMVIVTGANSGLGLETTRALVQKGATVIMVCRSVDKGKAAADRIMKLKPSGKAVVMQLDLSNLNSVRAFADTYRAKYKKLDLLINNAGIMFTPYGKTTQGFEQQFGLKKLDWRKDNENILLYRNRE